MFEVYVPRSREAKKKDMPEIKISKQSIVMNKKARNLIQADRLELAYDKDGKTIRIRRAEENGINMKKTKVYAKGFLEHFNIQEKGRFLADYEEDEDSLYVKVK
jgi:flagellar hook protein FlgE